MCVCVTVYINISMFVYVSVHAHTKTLLRSQDCNCSLLKTALTSSQLMELKHLGKTHGIHAKGSESLHSCRVPKVQSRSMI